MKGRLCALVVLLAAVACGGDSTSPRIDLTGTWTYTATNLTVSGITCSISGVSMTFTQTGNAFIGTVAPGGQLSCVSPAGTDNETLGSSVIANGIVNGSAVQFDIGDSSFHNAGSVSANVISGTASATVNDSGVNFVLVGSFSAVRH